MRAPAEKEGALQWMEMGPDKRRECGRWEKELRLDWALSHGILRDGGDGLHVLCSVW